MTPSLAEQLAYKADTENAVRIEALKKSMEDLANNGEYMIRIDHSNKDLAIYLHRVEKIPLYIESGYYYLDWSGLSL
jgi:hypothetical protein